MSDNIINMTTGVGVQGFYSFKAVKASTGEVRDISEIVAKDVPNMIVDSGLDALGSATNLTIGCMVGTGSSPVTPGDTNLASPISSTTTVQANSYGSRPEPPYFSWYRRTFRFGQGVAAGPLTEVGVYSNLSGTPLFSRALLVDAVGNPTTLTILSDEYLDVTYELRFYQKQEDSTFNVALYGEDYLFTCRPANITNSNNNVYYSSHLLYNWGSNRVNWYNGGIGAITSNPGGSSYSNNPQLSNYVTGSYKRDWIISLGLNEGNLAGGITAFRIQCTQHNWQFGVTPAIPKDNYKTLVLNITLKWERYSG